MSNNKNVQNKNKKSPKKKTTTKAQPGSYRKAGMHDSTYRVRGGGYAQSSSTRSKAIVIANICAAVALAIFGCWRLVSCINMFNEIKVISVTVEHTHEALRDMPRLIDYIGGDADDAFSRMTDSGIGVTLNDRNTSDNPDRSSTGKEIVYFPSGVSEEDIASYNASEFSSYDFDQLQGRLLGSWIMDVSIGSRGTFTQLKYVNLATNGLSEEMHWALDRQGLTDNPGTKIVYEGTDRYGNNVILGYTVMDDNHTVYWQALSCPFSARYHGSDNRRLPDSSAYVKIRAATWDFYDSKSYEPDDAGK